MDACGDKSKCPPIYLQNFYLSLIESNSATEIPYAEASILAQATGNTVVIGVSGNVGGSLWPEALLGGSAGASVGIGVDPNGDVGLVVSGQLGGGYNGSAGGNGVAYGGGGSITFTHQPTIFGLTGRSSVMGLAGGIDFGGSVTRTLGGSTTVTAGLANGISTRGGLKGTKVFPLICP